MRPKARLVRRTISLVLALAFVVAGTSYVRALTYPGNASWADRSVEWFRDHGGGPVVDAVENWYYGRQAPRATGAPDATLSPAAPHPGRDTVRVPASAPRVRLLTSVSPRPGEGTWQSLGQGDGLWQTWVRPDPHHLPVVAAAVLVPRGSAALHLVAGTREPVPDAHASARVPVSALGRLEATFNAGFKMKDAHGGWEVGSPPSVPLVPGRASLVLTRDGGWRVGAWGVDVGPAPDVVAVRQNLDLVVKDGHAVPGLSSNAHGRWGTSHTQFQYTWRSGIGVDRAGDLIYVAGPAMRLSTFASAMAQLGVVEGMQLDIHTDMVSFNAVVGHHGHQPVMRRLLSSMHSSARRYLAPDQRDFFYLTAVRP